MTFTLLLVGCCFAAPALAAPVRAVSPPRAGMDGMFVGTPAELVAAAMPEMLARIGVQVTPAPAAYIEALEETFQGDGDFAWDTTFIQVDEHGNGFSFTLPARIARLQQRTLVLGVVAENQLAQAVVVQATESEGTATFRFTLPDGTDAGEVHLGIGSDGRLFADPQDMATLAALFYPSTAKGVFDPIIEALQGVLNALYQVMNIINIAICAVNEAIEMLNEMNACPLGDIHLGTGDLARAIVCLVQDIVEFVDEVQGCF